MASTRASAAVSTTNAATIPIAAQLVTRPTHCCRRSHARQLVAVPAQRGAHRAGLALPREGSDLGGKLFGHGVLMFSATT